MNFTNDYVNANSYHYHAHVYAHVHANVYSRVYDRVHVYVSDYVIWVHAYVSNLHAHARDDRVYDFPNVHAHAHGYDCVRGNSRDVLHEDHYAKFA